MITDVKPISDLTYKIVAYPEVPDYSTDEFVDWALEMVFLGHESPYLYMLAGLVKPTYPFQAEEYLDKVLNELKLARKKGQDAIVCYCSYYVNKIARSEEVSKSLYEIYKLHQATQYDGVIFDFFLLQWAWDDLDWDNEIQYYWPGATKSNIESIVVEHAKTWLKLNEDALRLDIG